MPCAAAGCSLRSRLSVCSAARRPPAEVPVQRAVLAVPTQRASHAGAGAGAGWHEGSAGSCRAVRISSLRNLAGQLMPPAGTAAAGKQPCVPAARPAGQLCIRPSTAPHEWLHTLSYYASLQSGSPDGASTAPADVCRARSAGRLVTNPPISSCAICRVRGIAVGCPQHSCDCFVYWLAGL